MAKLLVGDIENVEMRASYLGANLMNSNVQRLA